MPLFKPTLRYNRITDIAIEDLIARNISLVLLDVDNTLTEHNSHKVLSGVKEWLKSLRNAGIVPLILSNAKAARVEPFAKQIGVDFVASAKKPLKGKYKFVIKNLGLKRENVAIVGDQIFTDILGGNRAKITTIFVNLITPESGWFFKLKRRFERMILK